MVPAFPFGHGLSYSQFDYNDLIIESFSPSLPNSIIAKISVTIKNRKSGPIGRETPQLYLAYPSQNINGQNIFSLPIQVIFY